MENYKRIFIAIKIFTWAGGKKGKFQFSILGIIDDLNLNVKIMV